MPFIYGFRLCLTLKDFFIFKIIDFIIRYELIKYLFLYCGMLPRDQANVTIVLMKHLHPVLQGLWSSFETFTPLKRNNSTVVLIAVR